MLEILKDYVSSKYGLDDEEFRKKFEKIKQKRWPYRFLSLWRLHLRLGWRFCAIIVGGAYLEPAVDQFWRGLAYALFQGYGLTETAPLVNSFRSQY
ncbi:MAG: hypothetical protein U5N58_04295 [Actinomycetota bacterium]|nr:hypothetical protein [Actinomycetota bacterium]